jgi:hypothetical protein
MKKTTSFIVALLLMASAVCAVVPALAITNQPLSAEAQKDIKAQDQAFIDASGLQPISLSEFISGIIRIILGFLGVIFIVLVIYAGLLWMTSAGNEDKIATAKQIMTAGVIGLAIVLMAYAITTFVLGQIFRINSSSGAQPAQGGSQAL